MPRRHTEKAARKPQDSPISICSMTLRKSLKEELVGRVLAGKRLAAVSK